MIKSKSQQKYLPKISHINLDTDFKLTELSKTKVVTEKHQNRTIEEPNSLLHKSKSLKSEILRIPKARQLLNMDKHVYIQDVQKRIELLGDVKQQNYHPDIVSELHTLCKPVTKKKTKRHKTNFKIPLTRKNIQHMNQIIKDHIDVNRKYKNKEVVLLPEYEKNAPFNLQALRFIDSLNQVNKAYKQKFQYQKDNLTKNKLLLEHVILNRNIKRQLKLNKDKEAKKQGKILQSNI